jgi:hypothetical protein
VWEALSCGLALVFRELLSARSVSTVARGLRTSRRKPAYRPVLFAMREANEDESQVRAGAALIRAALRRSPESLDLDTTACELGRQLVTSANRAAVHALANRHLLAKADDPWIRLRGDRVEVVAPRKKVESYKVGPRAYRLDSYRQILVDLRIVR